MPLEDVLATSPAPNELNKFKHCTAVLALQTKHTTAAYIVGYVPSLPSPWTASIGCPRRWRLWSAPTANWSDALILADPSQGKRRGCNARIDRQKAPTVKKTRCATPLVKQRSASGAQSGSHATKICTGRTTAWPFRPMVPQNLAAMAAVEIVETGNAKSNTLMWLQSLISSKKKLNKQKRKTKKAHRKIPEAGGDSYSFSSNSNASNSE